jgi:hypothetical protein
MNKNTLLVKTPQGREALARRPPELGPRMRSLLIMVDGRRSAGELARLAIGLGGEADMVNRLMAQGWVMSHTPDESFVPSVPFPDSQSARPSGFHAVTLSQARQLVSRFVNDEMGPMGASIAIEVETCRSMEELHGQLPRVRDSLKRFKLAAAQRFDQEVVPQVPRG